MHHSSKALVAALFLSLAAIPFANHRLLAVPPPDFAKPSTRGSSAGGGFPPPQKTATVEKLKELGTHLGRALRVACDLFSGNEANLLSNNKTALLSGNKPEILSGNKPAILSGNTTPILSGNTFSVLSNIRIEIHIENSGNHVAPTAPNAPLVPARPATGSGR